MLYWPTSIAVNGFLNNMIICFATTGDTGDIDAVKSIEIHL